MLGNHHSEQQTTNCLSTATLGCKKGTAYRKLFKNPHLTPATHPSPIRQGGYLHYHCKPAQPWLST